MVDIWHFISFDGILKNHKSRYIRKNNVAKAKQSKTKYKKKEEITNGREIFGQHCLRLFYGRKKFSILKDEYLSILKVPYLLNSYPYKVQ